MSQEHINNFICPKCKNKFRRGPDDRFGPAKIKCGKCSEISTTGLTEWAKLPLKEKVFRGVLEVVNPFHAENVISFILYHAGLYLIISIPLGFLMTGLGLQPSGLRPEELKNWKEVAPFVSGGIIYVAILIGRLTMRIIESQKYTNTGTPPIWN